jgi:hypothetical protein
MGLKLMLKTINKLGREILKIIMPTVQENLSLLNFTAHHFY